MNPAVAERPDTIDERFWDLILNDQDLVDLAFEMIVGERRPSGAPVGPWPGGEARRVADASSSRSVGGGPPRRTPTWARSPPRAL
ncbi:hypothetical protein SAMN04489806_1250 [Paramicrobacterium humi]|uniref:Uncharacterized protein n=1 Tax=Paramicrobacterium humi TaxID=640635 RepID=A0A1H4KP91_9MICO|nr:hypothetical protein [Microbacterium humi]SEB60301.1 hypothetical protein SAMN04489806_1250 [Microbacterium humi]